VLLLSGITGHDPAVTRSVSPLMSSLRRRGRVCFYCPYLYPVAGKGNTEVVGGTEVRLWALARDFARRGFDVTIVTCDFGQGPTEEREGVSLVRTYSMEAGFPGVRFFYPRLWQAMRALSRASADVYLAGGQGIPAGWAYHAARLRGSKFVFLAASDSDADLSLPFLRKRRERWWYLQALKGADARVSQTKLQQHLFRQNFSVESEVIPSPVDLNSSPADAGANSSVLWLSTYKSIKSPEWFTELARRLPEIRFVMVGQPLSGQDAESWKAARRAASTTPNLEVHGFVEHARVGDLLSAAALFIHTSPMEGFPMTLLEAWSHGIPSVTRVDPGGAITRHKLGEVVTSLEGLTDAVARMMSAPDERRAMGARARRYVEEHHGPERSYEPLAALLDRLISGRPRSTNP
jgi:glycosyltransferase involved in cell wall biosynthesis